MKRNQQLFTTFLILCVFGIMALCWMGSRIIAGKCILFNCPPQRTFTVLDLGVSYHLFPEDSYGSSIHRPSDKLGAQDIGTMNIYWRDGNGASVYNVYEFGTENSASSFYQALLNDGSNYSKHVLLSYNSEIADEQNIGCGFSQFGGYRCDFIARYSEFVISFNVTIDEEMTIEMFEKAVIYIDQMLIQKLLD